MKILPLRTILILLLCLCGRAAAELPPQVYADLQAKAGEVLKIRVDEVTSKPKGFFDHSSWNESVKATVLEVARSHAGTRNGDVISLNYQRLSPKAGWVGPSPPPRLVKGREYMAYLARNGEGFTLAARGMSFTAVK